MARNQDKRGFFQRACGRFVLIVSAVVLATIGIAVLVLAGQASEKLDFHVTYRGNSSTARLQIGSASCEPPFNVTITPQEAIWTLAGQYTMQDPREVATCMGAILLIVALLGTVGLWKRRDGLIFTYCYMLLLLLAAMLWVLIFCSVAAEKADTFLDQFWKMYSAANPSVKCGDTTYPLPSPSSVASAVLPNATASGAWHAAWTEPHLYFNTAGDVATAAGVSVAFILLSICGTIQALSSVDDAAMKMVRGSSGVLALMGFCLICVATWAGAEAPGQFAGDWGPQAIGVLGAILLLAGCCGCCGVRRLSRRCLALNVCGLFIFFFTCFVVTILTFQMASIGHADERTTKLEKHVLGKYYDVSLLQHVNIVAISSAILTVVVFANLCISVWLFKRANEVAERLSEREDHRGFDADEHGGGGVDERDIELSMTRRAKDEDYV